MIIARFLLKWEIKNNKSRIFFNQLKVPWKESFMSDIYRRNSISEFHYFHRVKFHQDKAARHTLKITTAFFEKMKINTSTKYTSIKHFLGMSSDISPMDYCAFGIFKHKPTAIEFRKILEKKWKSILLELLRKAVLSWKSWCRVVVLKQGYQIKH